MASLVLGGCGASGASNSATAPSVKSVIATMDTKSLIIQTLTGSPNHVHRVIVDGKARYSAVFSPSGRLLDVNKHGVEYRLLGQGCYGRFAPESPLKPRDLWFPALREITSGRHATSTSGDTIRYRSSSGAVMEVDTRTRLIRSMFTPAYPNGGVPAQGERDSYPRFVHQLGVPRPLCD
jgi:hypothetical protein